MRREFDLLGAEDFLLASQQRNLTHLHQIDADRVVDTISRAGFDIDLGNLFHLVFGHLRLVGSFKVVVFYCQFRLLRQLVSTSSGRLGRPGRTGARPVRPLLLDVCFEGMVFPRTTDLRAGLRKGAFLPKVAEIAADGRKM